MPRTNIERIREKIRFHQYDMSAHAMEEVAEDLLDIVDVEIAVLNGRITRIERDDPRGTKYVIEGGCGRSEEPCWYSWAFHQYRSLSYYHCL